jgi:thiosulfate reductase cytochrome b subunit
MRSCHGWSICRRTQSARTVHFITDGLIVLFVFVHVAMLILAGPLNELRSMITGKFVISLEDNHE